MSDEKDPNLQDLTVWQQCKAIGKAAVPPMEEQSAAAHRQLLDAIAAEGPEFAQLAALLENANGAAVEVPEGLISEEGMKRGMQGISERIRKNPNGYAE